jgi:carbon-monoxide dehydrogenase medium subunit/6-hydroxypseudooxynicotine dehydrogenase subunit alpha
VSLHGLHADRRRRPGGPARTSERGLKLPPFTYRRATSVEEALEALEEGGDDAKVLAGGQSLIPVMAFRLARPTLLVDVNDVPGLDHVAHDSGGLRIGALVRHAALERQEGLDGSWRALGEAVAFVGHYPIRVRGTFGGSVAHADPAAELCVVATTLGADVVLRSSTGERTVPAAEFFIAPFMTALAPGELVVEVRFPPPPPGAQGVFEEFAERSGDFALASVCAALAFRDGEVAWARIGLGSVAGTPLRARAAEGVLVGSSGGEGAAAAAADAAAEESDPSSDSHAGAEYRRHLVAVLVRRAVRRARAAAA